jgi:hypothetical protein
MTPVACGILHRHLVCLALVIKACCHMVAGEVKAELTKVLSDMVSRHQAARSLVTNEVVDAFMAVRPMAAMLAK